MTPATPSRERAEPLSAKTYAKRESKRADAARNFPENTCPASRHVQMIGDILAKGKRYPMIDEEPEHVAGSLLCAVASLYEARTEIERLKAENETLRLANIDALPSPRPAEGVE